MAKDNADLDFLNISKSISQNREDHEQAIKQNCVKTSIIPLSDFYEQYRIEIAKMNSEVTPSEVMPSISEFTDVFKSFEKYPVNLQKPKSEVFKELKRSNSNNMSGPDTTTLSRSCDLLPATTAPLSSQQNVSEQRSARKIYTDFKKFIQSLNQFLQEAQQVHVNEKYTEKLKQLRTFAEQLEKLRPTPQACASAFTDEEETKLRMILKNLEELDYIRDNYKLFENVDLGAPSTRTESIAQLINYLFATV